MTAAESVNEELPPLPGPFPCRECGLTDHSTAYHRKFGRPMYREAKPTEGALTMDKQAAEIVVTTTQNVERLGDWLQKAEDRAERIRVAGNELAGALGAFYADHDETKLRAAYEKWYGLDAGNFSS